MELECDLEGALNRKDEISGSTSKIVCANGSTTVKNSDFNVSNEMPLDIEQTSNTDQNMETSDTESTLTIGQISVDEYYDKIIIGKQPVVHQELYRNDQNEQSGSSNNANVVNNDDSIDNRENLVGKDLIINDINSALPFNSEVPRINQVRNQVRNPVHNPVRNRVHTHQQWYSHPAHRQSHEYTYQVTVCHRKACNNLVLPILPRCKPRAAAIEAAAKIAKYGTKKKKPNNNELSVIIYYACGHRERITGTPLNHVGIKKPMIMKESRLLDERLMKTTSYILKIPAEFTVHQLIHDYRRKANLSADFDLIIRLILSAFNRILPVWCLYFIERRQYNRIIKTYPNRQLSELYGLAHFFRFVAFLPRLYNLTMIPGLMGFSVHATSFINGLFDYMVENNLRVDSENDYELVAPEYHRLTYLPIRNRM